MALLFTPLLAVQVAVFCLRVNREVSLGDQGRRTWLPIPDLINILSLPIIAALCVIGPLAGFEFGRIARTGLAIGYTLMAFYPITIACHYRLFSRFGRTVYKQDYPYVTDHEKVALIVSFIAAAVVFGLVWLAR